MKYIYERNPDTGDIYRREFNNYNKREKMTEVKSRNQQERVVFGPNVNTHPTQQSTYAPNQPTARK